MKTIKKKVDLILTSSDSTVIDSSGSLGVIEHGYHFSSKEFIPNIDSLEFHVEFEEPETLKEFKKVHDLSSVELVGWLNKNYEK
tara:strand:- start:381 stop:632 length:252 start_codon:yes stop_codon:yes gene_type:complete